VKLRGQKDEDVQPGLPFHDGQIPESREILARVAVIIGGIRSEHDVVLDHPADTGPVVDAKRSHVDKRRRILKYGIPQHPPVTDADVLLLDAGIQQPFVDRPLDFGRGRKRLPRIALDADDVSDPHELLPRFDGVLFLGEPGDRLVEHIPDPILIDLSLFVQHILVADENDSGFGASRSAVLRNEAEPHRCEHRRAGCSTDKIPPREHRAGPFLFFTAHGRHAPCVAASP
jgi:hypothetical protein